MYIRVDKWTRVEKLVNASTFPYKYFLSTY